MSVQKKAVALVSGGLDSMLAVKLIKDQGIHVEGLNFFTGFCVANHTQAIRSDGKRKRNDALWVAEQLGIKLHFIDIVEEYKEIVLNPRYGYGANLNPCLDCKIFMVKKAKEWMEENGFDFIITGEVVGQRPKSQLKQMLPVVTKRSGIDDRLLRPLSAKLLEPTLPEREGWVDRELLMDFNGRGRKPQIAMAKQFGFDDYAQPAGGCCFLTDPNYTKRLSDLWANRDKRDYSLDDIMLLKVGRHMRPNKNFKMIIGREEGENNFLEGYRKHFFHMQLTDYAGPFVLLDGNPDVEDIELAARITARFSAGRDENEVQVRVTDPNNETVLLNVHPLTNSEIPKEWYL